MWAKGAKTGNRGQNDVGIPSTKSVVGQSSLTQYFLGLTCDDDVILGDQSRKRVFAFGAFNIQYDPALAGIKKEKARTLFGISHAIGKRPILPADVAPRGFYFYNIGTKISKELGAERTGHTLGDVQNLKIVEIAVLHSGGDYRMKRNYC